MMARHEPASNAAKVVAQEIDTQFCRYGLVGASPTIM